MSPALYHLSYVGLMRDFVRCRLLAFVPSGTLSRDKGDQASVTSGFHKHSNVNMPVDLVAIGASVLLHQSYRMQNLGSTASLSPTFLTWSTSFGPVLKSTPRPLGLHRSHQMFKVTSAHPVIPSTRSADLAFLALAAFRRLYDLLHRPPSSHSSRS